MFHLKIISPAYSIGVVHVGPIKFIDGVSEHPVEQRTADRLSAAMPMTQVSVTDGSEVTAGGAQRLIDESARRAPVVQPLGVQTEEEKLAELKRDARASKRVPVSRFYTQAELEIVIREKGLKGLRDIAEPWQVKGRAIPQLLTAILEAQGNFARDRDLRVAAHAAKASAATDPALDVMVKGDTDRLAAEMRAQVKADNDKAGIISEGVDFVNDLGSALDANLGSIVAGTILEDQSEVSEILPIPTESLYGSSVLASTYDIGGKTVQLGAIVAAAFTLFGGTITEWNDQPNDNREALLRLELDRLLAAE